MSSLALGKSTVYGLVLADFLFFFFFFLFFFFLVFSKKKIPPSRGGVAKGKGVWVFGLADGGQDRAGAGRDFPCPMDVKRRQAPTRAAGTVLPHGSAGRGLAAEA